MRDKPNLLFVFTDQHRHDVLGCAGHPLVATPTLDKLASEGARFTRAWCQSPVCMPSRASLITGRYTEDLGIFSNTHAFDPNWPTVMKTLQSVGYETATVGKTHYFPTPNREEVEVADGPYDLTQRTDFVSDLGWDYVLEEYGKYTHTYPWLCSPYTEYLNEEGLLEAYREQIKGVYRLTPDHWRAETSRLPQEHDLTSYIAARSMDWLRERSRDQPFFLKLAFVQPHVPLIDDPIWADYYRDADIELPEQTPADAPNDVWGEYLKSLNRHSQVQTMTDEFVRSGIRHYLGMVSLIDQKIGEVMALLDAQGELENTWIVYSSDHGEMLGEHHLWAKLNFYGGSVQVPLIIRPPGGTKGRLIDDLVELTDVTATLADIGGAEPPQGCRGRSLLPALAGQGVDREFIRSRISGFSAVRNAQYRFTLAVESGTPCELFDLQSDPGEMHNLVNDAAHADTAETFAEIAAMP